VKSIFSANDIFSSDLLVVNTACWWEYRISSIMDSWGERVGSSQANEYVRVELSKSPDEISEAILAGMVREDHLTGARLSTDGARALPLFMAALINRIPQRSLERDEIIQFVEANRSVLERTHWIADLISSLQDADMQDAMVRSLLHTLTPMQYVLDGRPQDIDVISNRLLYLCVALEMKINARHLSHKEAVDGWLDRESTKKLMSRTALTFMLKDYLENMDELEESRTGYVMLMAECAMLVNQSAALQMAAILLRSLPPPADPVCWLDLRQRIGRRLRNEGHWDKADEESLMRAVSRFADPVPDDDL
jgi:hypothetical protein